MPAISVSNVSRQAKTELYVLPFLAPRILASPIKLQKCRFHTSEARANIRKGSTQLISVVKQYPTCTEQEPPANSLRNCGQCVPAPIYPPAGICSTERYQNPTHVDSLRWVRPSVPPKGYAAGFSIFRNLDPTSRDPVVGRFNCRRYSSRSNGEVTKNKPQSISARKKIKKFKKYGGALDQKQGGDKVSSWNRRSLGRKNFLSSCGHENTIQLAEAYEPQDIWMKGFTILDAQQNGAPRLERPVPSLVFHPDTESWVESLFGKNDSTGILQIHNELVNCGKGWASRWLHIMLWLLKTSPPLALRVLQTTQIRPQYVPIYLDALEYIVGSYILDPSLWKHESQDSFYTSSFDLLEKTARFNHELPQRLIHRMLTVTPSKEVDKLYTVLKSSKKPISNMTLLHFATSFIYAGDYHYACRILKEVLGSAETIDNNIIKKIASVLLRRTAAQEDGFRISSAFVKELSEMGLQLNQYHYNIIMLNAIEAGDFKTALRIFQLFREHTLEPNDHTYAILLKGCKYSVDSAVFKDISEQCARQAIERGSPWIATEYFHYTWLYNQNQSTRELFRNLLQTYQNFFFAKPLVDLGIISHGDTLPTWKGSLKPNPPALLIMIIAYLQREDLSDEHISSIYRRFTYHVHNGNEDIIYLTKTPHVHNAFLMAFCQRPALLNHAPSIIRTMSRKVEPTTLIAQPDLYTWNILMSGYIRHNQLLAAEKVLELMTTHNLKPNLVTWNTLLSGYARLQDTDKVAQTLKHLEEQSLDIDSYTLQAMSKVKDRDALMAALRSGDGQNKFIGTHESDHHHAPQTLLDVSDVNHRDASCGVSNDSNLIQAFSVTSNKEALVTY